MKYINKFNEKVTAALLPIELRYKNLLYHSTELESFKKIIENDKLYGTVQYDWGISTSRNKHYAFGRNDVDYDVIHDGGDVQIILDRDLVKRHHKIKAYDWEEFKSSKTKTGEYHNYIQAEDKILAPSLKNVTKYIVGIHIVKNELIDDILEDPIIKDNLLSKDIIVFNEDWKIIFDGKTKDTNTEFEKIKDSKFNRLPDLTISEIVDNWDDVKDIDDDNIETIKYFVNNIDLLSKQILTYDKKGLSDGYHRLIAMKILGIDKFQYKLEIN